MTDDKTTHYKLPLPHAQNLLSEDVARLREALNRTDQALHEAATALAAESEARQGADKAESTARAAMAQAFARQRTDDLAAASAAIKKIRILALAGL